MNFETIASIVFVVLLTIFVFAKKKKLDSKFLIPYFLYFSMYRTKLGLKLMDSMAKRYRKTTTYIGYFGIVIGFLGMVAMCSILVYVSLRLFIKPELAQGGVGLVLPIRAKGILYVPFFYWIISIFLIATVHEFAHGLIARAHNMRIKSSGFAFIGGGFRGIGLFIVFFAIYFKIKHNLLFKGISTFFDFYSPDLWLLIGIVFIIISYLKNLPLIGIPIIPAAFVEPDEKEIIKRPHKQQLSVFAAGPMANITTAFVFFIFFLLLLVPVADAILEPNGIKFDGYVNEGNKTYPAEKAGIKPGELIKEIDGRSTIYITNMSEILGEKKPGDVVAIKTNVSVYQVKLDKNPKNESAAFLGITSLEESVKIKDSAKQKYGEAAIKIFIWIFGLFYWIIELNLGIGLFNLAPIGPLDGGRMLQLPLHKYFGKDKGNKLLAYISLALVLVVIVNVSAGFGLLNFLK